MMQRAAFILIVASCSAGCDHTSDKATVARLEPTAVESEGPFTETERASIRRQIEQRFLVDAGMPDRDKMVVNILVEMNPDGSVQSVTIEDPSDYLNWQRFAESCERAIYKSSPLHMPPGKPYSAWRKITLTFNAKEMLNQ